MRIYSTPMKIFFCLLIWISIAVLAGCASDSFQQGAAIRLTGTQEAPPVSTSATGSGQITVLPDRSVSGEVTTSGIVSSAAHIHEGIPGKNGPVIVPLTKISDNTWAVPSGAKLTASQYASYQAGNLYVNVHSTENPGGEIRGRITPPQSSARPAIHYGY